MSAHTLVASGEALGDLFTSMSCCPMTRRAILFDALLLGRHPRERRDGARGAQPPHPLPSCPAQVFLDARPTRTPASLRTALPFSPGRTEKTVRGFFPIWPLGQESAMR